MPKPTSYELLKDTYAEIRELRKEMVERFEKVEDRVDVIEDFKSKVLGITSIISVVSGAIFSWLWERITKNI